MYTILWFINYFDPILDVDIKINSWPDEFPHIPNHRVKRTKPCFGRGISFTSFQQALVGNVHLYCQRKKNNMH